MMYLPSDRLALHRDNVDALIKQLTYPGLTDERAYALIDFIMPLEDTLSKSQRERLTRQLVNFKWKCEYVYGRPHRLADNPGVYAASIQLEGYWTTRYRRESLLQAAQ